MFQLKDNQDKNQGFFGCCITEVIAGFDSFDISSKKMHKPYTNGSPNSLMNVDKK